jgi:hypothetical protein
LHLPPRAICHPLTSPLSLGGIKKPLMLVIPIVLEVAAEPIILNGSCPHFNLVILCHPKEWINLVTTLLE